MDYNRQILKVSIKIIYMCIYQGGQHFNFSKFPDFSLTFPENCMRDTWTGVTNSCSPLVWILKKLRQYSFRASKIPWLPNFELKFPDFFEFQEIPWLFSRATKFSDLSRFPKIRGPLATLYYLTTKESILYFNIFLIDEELKI